MARAAWIALTAVEIAAFALAPACKENRTGKASTTSGIVAIGREGATTAMASARCTRAARCNETVDNHPRWESAASCVADWKSRLSDDLTEASCPRGISQKEIDACVGAIRNDACGKPLETFEHLTACRTKALCL
ncbi:MAG: hypothetical protein JWM74_3933 [Myxococcaceae bacterium]|nr:hypothetical protein [Myxococcaceae bacterium]